ncbi:MAG: hypothetical protein ACXAEN_20300 [Candidatus Thorarchaeota archaeon]|jgi:hypothetical protein
MKGKNVVKYVLAGIIGVIIGGFTSGSYVLVASGCITLAGLATAFMLNWVYIAPLAGEHAKQRIINMVAEPSPDDESLLANLTAHIVGNMGRIAQLDQGKQLFDPLFDSALDRIDERWKATLLNRKSQVAKGAGQFAIPEGVDIESMAKEMRGDLMQWGDEMLDSFGFEEGTAGRKLGQAMIMRGLSKVGGNSGKVMGGVGTTPDYIGK